MKWQEFQANIAAFKPQQPEPEDPLAPSAAPVPEPPAVRPEPSQLKFGIIQIIKIISLAGVAILAGLLWLIKISGIERKVWFEWLTGLSGFSISIGIIWIFVVAFKSVISWISSLSNKQDLNQARDARSVGRRPRLGLWSVIFSGSEEWSLAKTEVAQEARIAYVLIVISFIVDLMAWFILIFGLLKNFITAQLFEVRPEDGFLKNTLIPTVICAVIGALYPLAFAAYELNFYRSDLSREGSQSIDTSTRFWARLNPGGQRVLTVGFVLVTLLLLVAMATILIQLPNAIEVSLWIILFVIFAMGIYRFGLFIGFVFGVRAVIIVLAAYVTSYPLEMMIYRERINEKHVEAKRGKLADRISLYIQSLGDPPPRSFDLYKISQYLNVPTGSPENEGESKSRSSTRGSLHSRYALCFSTQAQRFLQRRTLLEAAELADEKTRLDRSLQCAAICSSRVYSETRKRDLAACLNQLEMDYRSKGSGGLGALCLPGVPLSEKRRIAAVSDWAVARNKELDAVARQLGTIEIPALAAAHTKCINEPITIEAAPEKLLPVRRTIAHDVQVVDEWRQRLVPDKSESRGTWTLDKRYTPKLCAEALASEKEENFCVEAPGLSEQILIMTEIQNANESPRARAFALFIAMVLPLLVILNKLLASEELHRSLSRSVEWASGSSAASKETLMSIVVASGSTIEQRKQAILRLFHLELLRASDYHLIHALAVPEISALLTRLSGREY